MIPSDVGLQGVLEVVPVWDNLAIALGVPLAHINAFRIEPTLSGLKALCYWRDGRSGSHYPTIWRFLLEKIKECEGYNVSDILKKKALENQTWSKPQK